MQKSGIPRFVLGPLWSSMLGGALGPQG